MTFLFFYFFKKNLEKKNKADKWKENKDLL